MDADRWQKVQSIFLDSLDRDVGAREAFLVAACRDEPSVADEVRSMLAAHEPEAALVLEDDLLAPNEAGDHDALLGRHVGRHRIVGLLGRGGMGDVYLAERSDDEYHQQVAVKVLRAGLVGPDWSARFRLERQILARLAHPNIAPLLDGGLTDDGRPYLVTQFVDGLPLTAYCDQRRLTVDARVRVFRQVCDAVQHAHRNLVVHRDLKPGNILVTNEGEARLLDFGIAKLLDPDAVGMPAAVTRTEMRVMTPEYAAPEQVEGGTITTSTDVYALGVLLYELLTGRRPYLPGKGRVGELAAAARESAPIRPSTAIADEAAAHPAGATTQTVTPDQVAADRDTSVRRLRSRLRGDLDNIVLMALRKEPSRRYASVEAFGRDLARSLEGRPVIARPDTVGYRVRTFVRRHRLAVASTAAAAVLILTFSVVTAIQASRIAQHARDLARERDRVAEQVEKTTRVKDLTTDLFRVLDPNRSGGSPAQRLETASRRIVDDLTDQPALQAELMDEVVTIYINLGLYEPAVEMAEASLAVRRATFAEDRREVARSLYRVGEALFLNGRFGEAEQRFSEALARQRSALAPDDVAIGRTLVRLARLYKSAGRFDASGAAAEEGHAILQAQLGDRHAETAGALFQLAALRAEQIGPEAAEPLLHEVLAIQRTTAGNDHPDVAWTLVLLANTVRKQGRVAAALTMLEEALTIQRERYGDEHPDVSRTLFQVARVLEQQGKLEPAEEAYRQTLAVRRRSLGDEHLATAAAMVALGQILTRNGAFVEAEQWLRAALAIEQHPHAKRHRSNRATLEALATLYVAWKRPEELGGIQQRLADVSGDQMPETDATSLRSQARAASQLR